MGMAFRIYRVGFDGTAPESIKAASARHAAEVFYRDNTPSPGPEKIRVVVEAPTVNSFETLGEQSVLVRTKGKVSVFDITRTHTTLVPGVE